MRFFWCLAAFSLFAGANSHKSTFAFVHRFIMGADSCHRFQHADVLRYVRGRSWVRRSGLLSSMSFLGFSAMLPIAEKSELIVSFSSPLQLSVFAPPKWPSSRTSSRGTKQVLFCSKVLNAFRFFSTIFLPDDGVPIQANTFFFHSQLSHRSNPRAVAASWRAFMSWRSCSETQAQSRTWIKPGIEGLELVGKWHGDTARIGSGHQKCETLKIEKKSDKN